MRSTQDKDISIILTSFLMKIVGLWLADNRNQQRYRNFALIYTAGTLCITVCIGCRDIYYTWGNFADCIFISCNNLYVMIVVLKVSVLFAHKTEFFKLITFTQENFWRPSYDPHEQLILSNCKRFCTIIIVFINICVQGTCAGYMVTPIMVNKERNETDRQLPFNLWLDFPVSLSPYFEILFALEIICVYHIGVCYICFDNLLCILNLHVSSQFRILQYRLRYLDRAIEDQIGDEESDTKLSRYENEYSMKLKSCVRHHQTLMDYCKNLEDIFTIIILGQVLFLAIIICLVGFQLFVINAHPSRKVSLICNFVATLCQLVMFTYSCDDLMRQSASISSIIFSGPWTNLPMNKIGSHMRRNLIFIIMRSNRFCYLTAAGFFPVSLETSTAVLKTAMSYFTLLKQSSVKIENA
ncbi:PREDICTED: odorant receptor 49b-like [Eufriesea mexicana]|uniref:odorant receptor 49b-like n=1 Tax=Eufriesea mexicana TaxID=516756 RepID=UPI00083C334E|nr:PREDICTED: odorant receptor 49b-like [Eufriesea mexicana]